MDLSAPADLGLLDDEELALVKLAAQYPRLVEGAALARNIANFPRIVEGAALAREPHRIAFYLYDLAAAFHSWWNMGNDQPERRVIVASDATLTSARLHLSAGIGQVIKNGLALMGVTALQEMS